MTETLVTPETEIAAVEPTTEPEISATPVESTIDPLVVASINAQFGPEPPVPMPASMRPTVSDTAMRNLDGQTPSDAVILPRRGGRCRCGTTATSRPTTTSSPADELEDWEYGSLADYLERKQRGDSEVIIRHRSSDFDDDGFFLDEGPNRRRTSPS